MAGPMTPLSAEPLTEEELTDVRKHPSLMTFRNDVWLATLDAARAAITADDRDELLLALRGAWNPHRPECPMSRDDGGLSCSCGVRELIKRAKARRATVRVTPEAEHEHRPEVHLCRPPAGTPYMVICGDCQTVLYGEVTDEQAAVDDAKYLAALRVTPVEGSLFDAMKLRLEADALALMAVDPPFVMDVWRRVSEAELITAWQEHRDHDPDTCGWRRRVGLPKEPKP